MLPLQGAIWSVWISQPKALPLGYPIYGFQPMAPQTNLLPMNNFLRIELYDSV
jgi:hypothetical protein